MGKILKKKSTVVISQAAHVARKKQNRGKYLERRKREGDLKKGEKTPRWVEVKAARKKDPSLACSIKKALSILLRPKLNLPPARPRLLLLLPPDLHGVAGGRGRRAMGHGLSCGRDGEEHEFFRAAQSGDADAMDGLLAGDPSLARRATIYDRLTPLHVAAANGHLEAVSLLLDRGRAAPDALSRTKQTPLMLAAMHGKLDCVLRLLHAGANVSQVTAAANPNSTPSSSSSSSTSRFRFLPNKTYSVFLLFGFRS